MSVALPLPRFPSSYPSLFLPFLPFPLPFFPTRKSRSSPQPFAVPSHPFVRLTRFPSSSVPLCYPPLPSVPLPPSPPLCPPLPHLTSPLSPSASLHPPPFPSSLPLCPPLSAPALVGNYRPSQDIRPGVLAPSGGSARTSFVLSSVIIIAVIRAARISVISMVIVIGRRRFFFFGLFLFALIFWIFIFVK